MISRYLLNISIFLLSSAAYSATVGLSPSTLPLDATEATPFLQSLTITFQNNGSGNWVSNFTEVTDRDIVNDGGDSRSPAWGDYDNDGDLDLFVANYDNQNNFLYENAGDGTFTKITAGDIVSSGGNSYGSAWGDYDSDGDLDLLVANTDGQNNFLYENNGKERSKITIYCPTGIAISDPDIDGNYSDGVSVSLTSRLPLGVSVSSADVGSITLNFSDADSISNGDKFMVLFPVNTYGGTEYDGGGNKYGIPTNHVPIELPVNYSIFYGSGDQEVGGENTSGIIINSILNYATFAPDYSGNDDTSSDAGEVYPANPADVLSSGLPDWVIDQHDYDNDEVVNGNDTSFEEITLDNSEGADEMIYSLWFSTTDSLTQIYISYCKGAQTDGDNNDSPQPITEADCLDPAGDGEEEGDDTAGTWVECPGGAPL